MTYLIDNNLYEVDSISFEYLVNKGSTTLVENIPSIPTEDFEKLIVILEEKAKTKDLYMLYYILFCIASLTPLRINTIVDLNIDSVVEKGRTGIYAIKTVDKTSNGDKRDIQISLM